MNIPKVPVKLSEHQITGLVVESNELANNTPNLRFGQAFVHTYALKYDLLIFPELYYSANRTDSMKLIEKEIWNGETI